MKPARIAVVCVAAVAAIGLAFVVRAMGSSNGEPVAVATAAPAEPARPMAKILVAAKDLAPGQRLAEGDLQWIDWPQDQLNPLFITDGTVPVPAAEDDSAEEDDKPEGAVAKVARDAGDKAAELVGPAAEEDFFGSVVREPILAGEPIVMRKIVRAGDSGYLAAALEPGMRAMAIRVTVETAAGGFILPGDRVDVLLTREMTQTATSEAVPTSRFVSSTVMQNVKVLAVDQSTRAGDEEQAVVGATATLALRPSDAEALALAKSEGELSLVLRSYADAGGPSGRTATPTNSSVQAVKVFRGQGEPSVVMVQ